MREIIYKTIGKRGRTTIPFSFRMGLKITDKMLLKFVRCGNSVVITPMREIEGGICESGAWERYNPAFKDWNEDLKVIRNPETAPDFNMTM